jgi:hypothetical protein
MCHSAKSVWAKATATHRHRTITCIVSAANLKKEKKKRKKKEKQVFSKINDLKQTIKQVDVNLTLHKQLVCPQKEVEYFYFPSLFDYFFVISGQPRIGPQLHPQSHWPSSECRSPAFLVKRRQDTERQRSRTLFMRTMLVCIPNLNDVWIYRFCC